MQMHMIDDYDVNDTLYSDQKKIFYFMDYVRNSIFFLQITRFIKCWKDLLEKIIL